MAPVALLVTLACAAAPQPVSELRLLYFHATWCQSCAAFDAQHVIDEVKKAEPGLVVELVDVDADKARLEHYGVEVTPTLVLVDKDGFTIARPRIELKDPAGTTARILTWARKATGRGKP
jgi:thiol-disulfide isomerase/thioredoxin